MSNKQKGFSFLLLILIVSALVILGIASYFAYQNYLSDNANNNQTACTQDAQLCPDGSYVTRTGPNCDFTQCPNSSSGQTAGWNNLTNNASGFSMQYPNNFFDTGHTPTISVGDCDYQVFPNQCPAIDSIVTDNPAGNFTNSQKGIFMVNSYNYCEYEIGDAAMGHQYYYDYYATVKNNKCLVVGLVSSSSTCENYLPLEQGNAQQSQNYNDCVTHRTERPGILQQIVSTFKFSQ